MNDSLEEDDENETGYRESRERILTTAPACVKNFKLLQTPAIDRPDQDVVTSWNLSCVCGCTTGQVLGYRLQDFDPSLDGPLEFVRPLFWKCEKCQQTELIVDEHGYDNELGKLEGSIGSATYRGTGDPTVFACHKCGKSSFEVTVSFIYRPGSFDLFIDEPDLPPENFFSLFSAHGKCIKCEHVSPIACFEA